MSWALVRPPILSFYRDELLGCAVGMMGGLTSIGLLQYLRYVGVYFDSHIYVTAD